MANWTDTVRQLAPTVATALLGPLGGAAITAIGSALGIDKPTQKAMADAISSGQLTSDQIAALKTLEMQYQNDEKERGFKYEELVFKDIDSARQMAISTRSTTPTILSYGVLIGGAIMLWAVLVGYAKVDSVLAGTLIGYVVSEMKQVLQYWFGSSRSSQDKTDLLAQAQAIK